MKTTTLEKVEYTFQFSIGDNDIDDVRDSLDELLLSPEQTKEIVGETLGYSTVWQKVIKTSRDGEKIYDYVDLTADIDFFSNSEEQVHIIGFSYTEELTQEVLKSIYHELFTPLLKNISPEIKALGCLKTFREYSESEETLI